MANYLPVLLVSVTTNAIPDDSSLSTQPRGQVDYLSHEWREEDVWRSWRNMTRQKNEIANGARLENASWRTWWKQRNKLKTISPETLNWYVFTTLPSTLPSCSSRSWLEHVTLIHAFSFQAQRLRCHLALWSSAHSYRLGPNPPAHEYPSSIR